MFSIVQQLGELRKQLFGPEWESFQIIFYDVNFFVLVQNFRIIKFFMIYKDFFHVGTIIAFRDDQCSQEGECHDHQEHAQPSQGDW